MKKSQPHGKSKSTKFFTSTHLQPNNLTSNSASEGVRSRISFHEQEHELIAPNLAINANGKRTGEEDGISNKRIHQEQAPVQNNLVTNSNQLPLQEELSQGLNQELVQTLIQELAPVLAPALTQALNQALNQVLNEELVQRLIQELAPSLAPALNQALAPTLNQGLPEVLPPQLPHRLERMNSQASQQSYTSSIHELEGVVLTNGWLFKEQENEKNRQQIILDDQCKKLIQEAHKIEKNRLSYTQKISQYQQLLLTNQELLGNKEFVNSSKIKSKITKVYSAYIEMCLIHCEWLSVPYQEIMVDSSAKRRKNSSEAILACADPHISGRYKYEFYNLNEEHCEVNLDNLTEDESKDLFSVINKLTLANYDISDETRLNKFSFYLTEVACYLDTQSGEEIEKLKNRINQLKEDAGISDYTAQTSAQIYRTFR